MTDIDNRVGPILDQLEIWVRYGIQPAELDARVTGHALLALTNEDGDILYPERLFARDGSAPFGLLDILTARDPDKLDPVETAAWLNTRHEALGDRTPYDVMEADPVAVWWLALITRAEQSL